MTDFFVCSSITLKLLILVVTAKYAPGCLDLVDFTRVLPLLFGCPDALTFGYRTGLNAFLTRTMPGSNCCFVTIIWSLVRSTYSTNVHDIVVISYTKICTRSVVLYCRYAHVGTMHSRSVSPTYMLVGCLSLYSRGDNVWMWQAVNIHSGIQRF